MEFSAAPLAVKTPFEMLFSIAGMASVTVLLKHLARYHPSVRGGAFGRHRGYAARPFHLLQSD